MALGRCLSILDVGSFGLGGGSFSTQVGVVSSRGVSQQRSVFGQASVPVARGFRKALPGTRELESAQQMRTSDTGGL